MAFKLGKRSIAKLEGVHPDLVAVVNKAITVTTVDFAVIEGKRTLERQRQLVNSGASQTMASRHLTGHAVDLAVFVGNTLRWDWPLYPKVADAMRLAATELQIPVVWGGCWKVINGLTIPMEQAVEEYSASRRGAGKRPFLDGPHFELWSTQYPL